ncbi:MAG: thiamine diphosphokinase [Clostridia bacterium]|nr:thiamine diphosphokinase [Clostridia bacterium]
MKAAILLNGEPYCGGMIEGDYVICCDGAYEWAKYKVHIDELLGDFDSLSAFPEGVAVNRFPVEKNATDGELALEHALDMGASFIAIYGGGGLREDHFLGNLHLLYKAHKYGAEAVMFTERAQLSISEHLRTLSCAKGKTVSIIPFGGDAHILHSSGFQYPMEDLWLRYGSTRGISNVIASEEGAVFYSEGTVLVVVNERIV